AGHFPIRAIAKRRVAGGAAITGEASPYYMFHPLAGHRIAADLPRTRLVVLVRDPVDRAYSAHKPETARGLETVPPENEKDRPGFRDRAVRGGNRARAGPARRRDGAHVCRSRLPELQPSAPRLPAPRPVRRADRRPARAGRPAAGAGAGDRGAVRPGRHRAVGSAARLPRPAGLASGSAAPPEPQTT